MFTQDSPKTTYARFVKTEDGSKLVISVYRGKDGNGVAKYENYASFSGYFRGITHRPAPADRTDLRSSFQFHFQGLDGNSVTFEVADDSAYGHKMIAALGSAQAHTICKVSPYLTENKTKPGQPYYNVAIRDISSGDTQNAPFVPYCLDMRTDLPEVEKVMYKGKEMIDNSNRVVFFKNLATQIDARAKAFSSAQTFRTTQEHGEWHEKNDQGSGAGNALYASANTVIRGASQVAEGDDELPF